MQKNTMELIKMAIENDSELSDMQKQGILQEIRRKEAPRPKLITSKEACEILQCGKAQLSILCKRGLVARIKYSQVSARYYLETVEYYRYHGEAMPGIEALLPAADNH